MRGANYAELAAFVAVAEDRSFARAARRLGLSRSALSHSIRELEERLSVRLLNRTTRSVALTDAGSSLLERIAPAFSEIGSAVEDLHNFRDQPSGTVRISLPRIAAELLLTPAASGFLRDYPDIRLELSVDDGLIDIVAGGFDAGIRPAGLLQRDMIAVRLTPSLRSVIVGSPDYFASHPKPVTPQDLADHACINYRWNDTGALYHWPLSRDGEAVDVAPQGSMTINDSGLVLSAALAGAGLACTLDDRVAGHVAEGRLVRVLEDWCQPFPGFFLYHPSRRQMPPALRALVDFLKRRNDCG
jgi:DNA-binding transcriptional LysR family regulator